MSSQRYVQHHAHQYRNHHAPPSLLKRWSDLPFDPLLDLHLFTAHRCTSHLGRLNLCLVHPLPLFAHLFPEPLQHRLPQSTPPSSHKSTKPLVAFRGYRSSYTALPKERHLAMSWPSSDESLPRLARTKPSWQRISPFRPLSGPAPASWLDLQRGPLLLLLRHLHHRPQQLRPRRHAVRATCRMRSQT